MSRRPAEPRLPWTVWLPAGVPALIAGRTTVRVVRLAGAACLALGSACASVSTAESNSEPSATAKTGSREEASGVAVRIAILADSRAVPDGVEARVGFADDASAWPSGPFVRRAVGTFRGGRVEVLVEDVPRGRWAIVAYADLDGDGELARSLFGAPREPIGYGNDAVPRFGPPRFEACVVEVGDRPVETALTLRVD